MEHKRENHNRINFRPLVFCALGIVFGVFLYGKIAFGGLMPSDFLFMGVLLCLALLPFSWKRFVAVLLTVGFFAGLGALALHLKASAYESTAEEGNYEVVGTVVSVSDRNGYTVVDLKDLTFDGESVGGLCRVYLPATELYPADRIGFSGKVSPVGSLSEEFTRSGYFPKDIRYTAQAGSYEPRGYSKNIFLQLNASLLEVLRGNMGREEAGVAYALLTGNSGEMDSGFLTLARQGGIAHIFAVSGLHIGILFGAVWFLCRPMGKYRLAPALIAAFCYSALCNFTISSARAVIMCGVLGVMNTFGKKYDFLDSISLAAVFILLLFPSEWFSAGFRLSFGACLGLALFSGSFSRMFAKCKLPKLLGSYLAANLSVQIFLLPIQLESFGYVSVWGTLLNFFVIPVLPVLFLGLLLTSLLALMIPPAAGFLLALPAGLLSLFVLLFSVVDPSFVLKGVSLGAGAVVYLIGCLLISERIRLSRRARAVTSAVCACLFTILVMTENVVFVGCKIEVQSQEGKTLALVSTRTERVLLLDGDVSLSDCEDFLRRTYGGTLDAVVVLSENEADAINTAAFLPARRIYARDEVETGLRETELVFSESFSCGTLIFFYEGRSKLILYAEELAVEFDFGNHASIGADLFVSEASGSLKYFLKDATIKEL